MNQEGEVRHIALRIAYRGTNYFGWQIQPHQPTVQGILNKTLCKLFKQREIKTIGASRTDCGVHAHDQYVSFQTNSTIPLPALKRALNMTLPPDIQVLDVFPGNPNQSARYGSRAKHYAYLIFNQDETHPLISDWGLLIRKPLDIEAMNTAAQSLLGTRCFKAFQSHKDFRTNTKTSIFLAQAVRRGNLVHFDILGSHFLYLMVRNITGSLLMVGKGDWSVDEFVERLEKGQRSLMGMTAPPQGLHLYRVYREGEAFEIAPHYWNFLSGIEAMLQHNRLR